MSEMQSAKIKQNRINLSQYITKLERDDTDEIRGFIYKEIATI